MQPSPSTIRDFPSSMANTACGQTTAHIPQPSHLSRSSVSVTTPGKYRSSNMAVPSCSADLDESSHQPQDRTQQATGRLNRRRYPNLPPHARKRCKGTRPREVHGQETRHRGNQQTPRGGGKPAPQQLRIMPNVQACAQQESESQPSPFHRKRSSRQPGQQHRGQHDAADARGQEQSGGPETDRGHPRPRKAVPAPILPGCTGTPQSAAWICPRASIRPGRRPADRPSAKRTRRISDVAFMPAARNAGRSSARTGPYTTRKPLPRLTSCAATPGCAQLRHDQPSMRDHLLPASSRRFGG